jgi:predicted nucleotidyltransferase
VNRPDAILAARAVVARRYPNATQAWLSGSVVLGEATPTSDLDITVLLEAGPAHRESVRHDGWPVELFVHTEASVRAYVAKDLGRRRPTMARLVAAGRDGAGPLRADRPA